MSDGGEESWDLSSLFSFRARVRAPAARGSRSKVSATCKTALLAPGSVNCPATSRACSARSSHSQASLRIDGIFGPPSIVFPRLLLSALFIWASERLRAVTPAAVVNHITQTVALEEAPKSYSPRK